VVALVWHRVTMVDTGDLLAAYDAQMRMPAGAVPSGMTYEYDGPILRIVGGHVGRIRAPRDVGVIGAELDRLIARQRDYFRVRGQGVEWKLRAHDLPADLPERLVAAGFVPQEAATVLLALAEEVAAEPVLPRGVVVAAGQRGRGPAPLRRPSDRGVRGRLLLGRGRPQRPGVGGSRPDHDPGRGGR